MKRFYPKNLLLIILSFLLVACSGNSAYWIPPYASQNIPAGVGISPEDASTGLDNPSFQIIEVAPAQTPDPIINDGPGVYVTPITGSGIYQPGGSAPASQVENPIDNTAPILYYTQAADTLPVVSIRFGVEPEAIVSAEPIPESGFIDPGKLLVIPRVLGETTSSQHLFPDSEVVYSPSATDFDAVSFAKEAGGYLSRFKDWLRTTGSLSGAETIMRVAVENSINPRLLMALLEYHGGWVYGEPANAQMKDYPMGVFLPMEKYLYNQLVWVVNQISIGYYDYREGRLTEIQFKDGVRARLAPDLNAGTAALQYYFASRLTSQEWAEALNPQTGFPALYVRMFGDPWVRAQNVEPLFPTGIAQPALILPFERNYTWSLTGGPHGAWEKDGAYAALDFAPGSSDTGCVESNTWVLAIASGLVVRTGPGLVVIDLDGDGREQTGWVIVYLHIATRDQIPLGSWVATGDHIGHASCEGGFATGTHIHIARKFNGEWVPADGPLSFNLGGWIASAGDKAYQGTLVREGVTIIANPSSTSASLITRTDKDP